MVADSFLGLWLSEITSGCTDIQSAQVAGWLSSGGETRGQHFASVGIIKGFLEINNKAKPHRVFPL